MKKIEIIKNYQDGNRYRLKGDTMFVLPRKAKELIDKKVAKALYKDIETTMKKVKKEIR
jgi:hypothetical protein